MCGVTVPTRSLNRRMKRSRRLWTLCFVALSGTSPKSRRPSIAGRYQLSPNPSSPLLALDCRLTLTVLSSGWRRSWSLASSASAAPPCPTMPTLTVTSFSSSDEEAFLNDSAGRKLLPDFEPPPRCWSHQSSKRFHASGTMSVLIFFFPMIQTISCNGLPLTRPNNPNLLLEVDSLCLPTCTTPKTSTRL